MLVVFAGGKNLLQIYFYPLNNLITLKAKRKSRLPNRSIDFKGFPKYSYFLFQSSNNFLKRKKNTLIFYLFKAYF